MTLTPLVRAGDFLRGLEGWRARGVAFISGLASALAFAPFNLFFVLLAAIVVLVLLIDGASDRPRFSRNAGLLGWFWGFGAFLGGLYWVGYAFMVDPSAHAWQLPFAIVFLTGGLALFPGAATAVAALAWRKHESRLFIFAGALSLSEWLRGHILTGFPWNVAAYAWGASLGVLQCAALIGAYGLTLLTLLFGAALAELLSPNPRLRFPAAMAALFAVLWIGGDVRLAMMEVADVPGVTLRIVQPDVPQAEKYKRQFVLRNWERLLALSLGGSKSAVTHLIWPEAAPPFLLQREPVAIDQIGKLTARGLTLITGGERVVFGTDDDVRFYNALFMFDHNGHVVGVYDKFHLVPFGEYVPFAGLLNHIAVTKLTRGEAGFSAGDGPKTFAVPGAPPAGPLICYEILFPGAVVGAQRPGWLINVTDDSWFGPSTGPYQHLLTARVRAIEEGIPVARAANTGISAVIDPLGRTKATLPLNEMGALDAPLPAAIAPTPYARFGDAGFWLLLAALGLTGVAPRRK
jgi:apolipoprotein N-acyltransferase